MFPYRRILIPFGDLAGLQQTLPRAIKIAQTNRAEIVLLRLVLAPRLGQTLANERLWIELRHLLASLSARGIVLQLDTMYGPTQERLADYIADGQIDLTLDPNDTQRLWRPLPPEPRARFLF